MNNNLNQSLQEEMEIIEEFNKQLASVYYLYNKLQDKLEEKNKLITLLTRDLIDTKKEIEELHMTIEFYKGKNTELQSYLEENNNKLEETRENLISEIKRLYEENCRYEEINRRQEEVMCTATNYNHNHRETMCGATAVNDDSFAGFNAKIRPIDRNGNVKR
jgi:chromosome segregation ATPase